MLILLFFCVYGKNPSTIPITGSPPNRRYLLTAIFDLESNQLISFCGFDYNENGLTSQINAFNLESKTWKEIIPESSFSPSPFQSSKSYLRSDRKVLIFFGENVQGISSDVYSFDLKTNSWRTEKLIGDTIEGRSSFGFTSFLYLGNEYVGVFGGLTHNGQNNDLFM